MRREKSKKGKVKSKKMLSLLLAICLVVSLMPAIPVAATKDYEPVNLITNGNLESSAGWELYYSFNPNNDNFAYSKIVTGDAANAYEGSGYLQIAPSGSNHLVGARTPVFSVTPGEEIVLKYRVQGCGSVYLPYELRAATSSSDWAIYNGPKVNLTSGNKAGTGWTEVEQTVTIPENCTEYAFGFVIDHQGEWGSDAKCYRFDDIRAYRVDADYVNYAINQAVDGKDETELGKWLSHKNSGLTDVTEANMAKYMSALVSVKTEKGKSLTMTEIQTILAGVNGGTFYRPENLITNGDLESSAGWEIYYSYKPNNDNFAYSKIVTGDAANAYEGSGYLQIAPSGANHLVGARTPMFSVTPGEEIVLKYRVQGCGSVYLPYELRAATSSSDWAIYNGPKVNLTSGNKAGTGWTEVEQTVTIPENCTEYAFGFVIDHQGEWGSDAKCYRFDDIRAYRVDADYVNYAINQAVDGEDATGLSKWLGHEKSGLTNVTEANIAQYMSALISTKTEKGRNLTKSEIQKVIDGINDGTLYVMANLVSNGSFEKVANGIPNGWSFYDEYTADAWPKTVTEAGNNAYAGENYVEIAPAGFNFATAVTSAAFPVQAGDILIVQYAVKGGAGTSYQLRGSADTTKAPNYFEELVKEITPTTSWKEEKHEITVPEGATSYAISFYINKSGGWGDQGYVIDFDDVRVYKVDADYVAHEINATLTAEDTIEFRSWIAHTKAELTGYGIAYWNDYYNALLAEQKERARDLTHSEIQAVINAVNTARTTGAVTEEIAVTITGAGMDSRSEKIAATAGETYYVEAKVSGDAANVQMNFEQWAGAAAEPGKTTTTTHVVSNTASRIYSTFTMNIDYDGFTVSFSKAAGQAGNVTVSDVNVYKLNKGLVLRNVNTGIEEQDQEFFYTWATHTVSSLTKVKDYNLERYMAALESKKEDKGVALTYEEIQTILNDINWKNKPYETENIGTQLELFVEDSLIDLDDTTAALVQKLPQEGNIVYQNTADERYAAYYTIFKDDDIYRMYYRALDDYTTDGNSYPYATICYAESTDGVNWTRPNLGICESNGSTDNNIIFDYGTRQDAWAQKVIECFYAFKDSNPNVAADALYKGVLTVREWWGSEIEGKDGNVMYAFKSEDGIHWEIMNDGNVIFDGRTGHGHMDSHNEIYWNEHLQKYVMFFRENLQGNEDGYAAGILRTASTLVSDDFVTWDTVQNATGLEYEFEDMVDDGYYGSLSGNYQIYTNGVMIYDRAPQLYIGLPTRYLDAEHRVAPYLIASRDGVHFKWWSKMLSDLTGDRSGNRSNYAAYGLVRTSDTEYTMYVDELSAAYPGHLRQFTFRVDGFVAAHGDESGEQTLLTKPIKFAGDHLILNYAAGNGGSVVARLLDKLGNVIEGFDYTDCTALTGDSIGEELKWTGDLSTLIGNDVKIQFKLKNTDLYSYQFMEGTPVEFEKVSEDVISGVTSTRLNWKNSEFALSYKITLAEDIGFTKGVKEYTSLANFVDVTGLDAAKSYYWKVEAIGAEGTTVVTDVQLNGYTVTLGGKLGVNFYMNLSENVAADAVMKFTHNGKTTEVAVKDAEKTAYGYKFTYEVAAKEMADTITAQMFSGDKAISDTYTYSVKEYADTIIANANSAYSSQAVTLAKAMLNYGTNAQIYFKYNTTAPANSALNDSDKNVSTVTAESLKAYANATAQGNDAIGTLAGSSLILESETTLKFYFKLADGVKASELTFKVGGKQVDATASGNYYYVAVEDIAAHNLNDNQTVAVTGGSNTLTATYNVMTYCYNVLSRETTDTRTEALKDVVRAMYLYNQAADAYLEGGQ